MNVNRGLLFWALALITAGVVALAVQQGLLDRDTVAGAWRLWPVILIAIGLSILLARTPFAVVGTLVAALVLGVVAGALVSVGPFVGGCGGDTPTQLAEESGSFAGATASVTLDFNCGELDVAMTEGNAWETLTGAAGDDQPRVEGSGDALTVRSPSGEGFDFGEGRQRWEIALGSEVTYDLSINPNAGDIDLDLSGGQFSELDVNPNAGALRFDLTSTTIEDFGLNMNAGSVDITAEADSRISGSIGMNAGAVDLCVPSDVPMRFEVEGAIFGHNLDDDEHGLEQVGETFTSPGFNEADAVIDLRIEGNAASFNLNPEGGCE
ncbi:MAG TPA: DUF5668 domain-containing protein [Candidatus Limnocylindria bacterium]|nr:DUF5668 domain-containing protein [Candidatus Limnocylindria bacterium]